MGTDHITLAHQRPWEWTLDASAATRLPASPLPRWLAVTNGRVWLTRSGAGPDGDDVWLGAGERHALPPGSEWVVEGWPQATLTLLEAPVRQRRGAGIGDRLARLFGPGLRTA